MTTEIKTADTDAACAINCAHDDAAWWRMIAHLRQAERSLGRACRAVMDLAGPKLPTGPLEPGPSVVKIRPARDVYGRATAPARDWLTATGAPAPCRRSSSRRWSGHARHA